MSERGAPQPGAGRCLPFLLEIPERHPGRIIITIGVLFALAYGVAAIALQKPDHRIVIGDAEGHYVQLRSMVFDRDLQFRNDYARVEGLVEGLEPEAIAAGARTTPTGYARTYMPVGPALLWAPLFLLVTVVVWLIDLFGAGYPLDGVAPAFQLSAGFTGIAAATAGSWLAYKTAAQLFGARTAIWATLALWLSSSALYYSLVSPTYSHAASMFSVGAFWLVWARTLDRQTVGRYAILGALAGVAALMRWQDAVLLIVPALDAVSRIRSERPGHLAMCLAACALAAALAFAPQMVVWHALYGRPFTVPQGAGFMRWGEPALWSTLLSTKHGLVTWSPVVALSLAGFVPLTRRQRLIGTAVIVFFAISWYVNASVADWWAGEAFGARRFLSCYPIFVLGLAALIDRLELRLGTIAAATACFIAPTLLLLVQYQAFMHGLRQVAPYPEGMVNFWIWRFRTPFDLAAWWLHRQ